ncbi:Sodium-dependent neutral amino acid transporter SLC6A17 [Fragariocoptes setiger]|uniref:Sodium-dependent neutral amino acid transporter SLC6A17 n=1 Tax=Fragariocoptes setiger TaxID=1670756 RepID=A0ABQ7S7I4_9ACAR|nr:Sodium-dependent neutral amino acid transporter SLC6A17 [Fragariocoptes setiger]
MLNEMRSDSHEKFDWNRAENGRPVWNSKTQYLLAVTSYSIGLGNVWRFPMLVQKNGGAAFIIPFVIMLIIEGIPLFYLELAIGQRMRKAAVSSWNMISPFAAGIGIASAVVSFNVGLYYNTIVAWCLYYFWSSFRTPLPFSQCPTWSNSTYDNANNVVDKVVPECQASSPTQYYWYRETLDVANDINEWNGFNYPIIVCLALAWAISYICLVKGLSSAKYVVYVTATFPYVILTIFLFKALTLEGMSDGIYHLFAPKWHKLADAHVWMESASQVFYSLGLGFGGLIALSSYNPVNNNCYRDAIIVSVLNVLASLYAGLVIFAVLGFKAHNQFDKCVANRELMIDWYLGDHNLRITDFTSAQQNNAYAATELVPLVASVSERGALEAGALFTQRSVQQSASESVTAPTSDYYDVNDALNSIQSLDRQLDQQQGSGQTLDYGDTDTEFIIDASNMISSDYLKSVIDSIPNLPQCDLSAELDKSASGTGLAFIVFTEAVNQFPNASLWAIIFFLMLLTLGLDSQFGNLEGLLASLNDFKNYPRLNRQNVTGVICGISFLLSLQFAHGGGSYFLAIFDQFAGNFPLVIIALFEILAVSHIYGLKRFSDDLELMNGSRPSIFMLACWRYLAPITLVVVMLASAYDLSSSLEYQTWSASKATLETRPWPAWCINMGLFLIISSTIWIPLVAIMCVFKIQLLEAENFSVAWFPSEELREFHNVPDHKVTPIERMLFGFTDDD